MYKVGISEWNKICLKYPEFVRKNILERVDNGKVSKRGEWSCLKQLLSHDPEDHLNVVYENIDFKIVEDNKLPIQTVTKYWDNGNVDMVATRIMAGEPESSWSSTHGKGFEEYTDLFPNERGYREFKKQCTLESVGKFNCVENF